jgi:gas vesicle protein
MRTIKRIGFGLAACLPALTLSISSASALDERALREECSALSQAEMRDCLPKKAENSQDVLTQVEKSVDSIISKWDEDSKCVSRVKANLSASNKEFVKYRESQCELSASLGGGAIGNALEMRRLACVSELNSRRSEQLRDAVSDLPLK